jgi:hypothetical protein
MNRRTVKGRHPHFSKITDQARSVVQKLYSFLLEIGPWWPVKNKDSSLFVNSKLSYRSKDIYSKWFLFQ